MKTNENKEKKASNYYLNRITQVKIELNHPQVDEIYKYYADMGYIAVSAFIPDLLGLDPKTDKEWLDAMAARDESVRYFLKRIDFRHTHLWSEYMRGDLNNSAHKSPIKLVTFIIFNSVRLNITRGADADTTIKEIGKEWCQRFDQSTFLYVPSKEEKTIDNPGNNPAYILDSEGRTKDIFSSLNLLVDIDYFLKIYTREINSSTLPEHQLHFQSNAFYVGKRPWGLSANYHRDGEAYCSIIEEIERILWELEEADENIDSNDGVAVDLVYEDENELANKTNENDHEEDEVDREIERILTMLEESD